MHVKIYIKSNLVNQSTNVCVGFCELDDVSITFIKKKLIASTFRSKSRAMIYLRIKFLLNTLIIENLFLVSVSRPISVMSNNVSTYINTPI